MCQLVRYFGRYPCAQAAPIQRTLELQRTALLRRYWSALHSNSTLCQRYRTNHDRALTRKAWGVLIRRWAGLRSLKTRVMARQCEQGRLLKQSVLRSLGEIIYSQQVYSKRCQFITTRANSHLRQRTLHLWQEATLAKISHQDALLRKGHSAAVFLHRFTLRRVINTISWAAEEVQ